MAVTTFNLIYHITPFVDSKHIWQANLRQLLRRIHIFHKRIVSISTGEGINPPEEVQELLGDTVKDYIIQPNDHKLRERASFLKLLERVASNRADEATFYAHAKGVRSRGDPVGIMYWRNLMYHVLLDDMPRIVKELAKHPILGTHRRKVPLPDFRQGNKAPWHFAGTFFWFRHDEFFSRPWRTKVPNLGYGVEGAPGALFNFHEGECLVKDGIANPYNPNLYTADERFTDAVPTGAIDLKVELGGGEAVTARGNGYINVDRCPSADVVMDLENLGEGLPFASDSVASLYSSHCIEHIANLRPLMREILRIVRVDGTVELRVPHWNSSMALCFDHKHTISRDQINHWVGTGLNADFWFSGIKKKLVLTSTEFVKGPAFERWKRILPNASDQDILELCNDGCHESRWTFSVAVK